MLAFVRHFSLNYSLEYILPMAAIILVALFYLLGRTIFQRAFERRTILIARGFLMAPLLAVAILSVENYRATDYYRFDSYLNAYEFYHYYIGTKYAREVGYTNMYAATLVADYDTDMKWAHDSGTIRNLATGRRENHKQFLADADKYRNLFSPERWEEFKKDIEYFKDNLVQGRWNGVIRDKGYNGTPVWSMLVGGLLSNRISTDSPRGMMFLALLDPLLILLAFGVVMWAFGPRTALLMLILLGTHYMMKWWHMKGAYLRTDWAMCLVMAVCMIRKKHFATAGALTGYAMLSRIFPAVLLFGVGAKFFWALIDVGWVYARDYYNRLELHKRPANARVLIRATLVVFVITFLWGSYGFTNGVIVQWMGGEERTVGAFFSLATTSTDGHSAWMHMFTLIAWAAFGGALAYVALRGLYERKLDTRYIRFFVAFALTVGSFTAVSLVYWRGTDNYMPTANAQEEESGLVAALPGYWQEYVRKIGQHSQDISTWRVGYKYIFMADFGDNFSYLETPINEWSPRVRSALYNERRVDWWHTQIWILVLATFAAFRMKDYRAYILGFVPLFFLVSPTYYYYIMLLVPLLFFAPRIEHGRYALGLCMMYIAGMSGFVFYDMWRQEYSTYYWLSVQLMVMVLYMLALGYTESIHFALNRLAAARNTPGE